MTRHVITGLAVLGPHPMEADSVVIEEGKVVAVGLRKELGAVADSVDYDGFILPGMRDAHIHPSAVAAGATTLDLRGMTSFDAVADLLTQRAEDTPPNVPIIGHNLDDELLGFLPTRHHLDLVGRPVLLYRVCSHIAVANSAALDLAGVGPSTPDPPGGCFDRDPEPNGILRETAITPVASAVQALVPGPTSEQLMATMRTLLQRGITTVDAMVSAGTPLWCGAGNELADLIEVAPQVLIDIDVYVMTDNVTELEEAASRVAHTSGRLRFGGWKGFADGSLGGHTAWLRSRYADLPNTTGTPRLDFEKHAELVRTAIGLGGAATIHAIGDAAVAGVLDLYGTLKTSAGTRKLRIEHASVLSSDLVGRIAAQGVMASVQPSFAVSDAPWLEKRLGSERASWTYALDRLADAGVQMRTGSDAPVEEPDPWATLAAAIQKTRLEPAAALAATVAHELREGSPADLVVVDRNPLVSRPSDLTRTRVLSVWKHGVEVVGDNPTASTDQKDRSDGATSSS